MPQRHLQIQHAQDERHSIICTSNVLRMYATATFANPRCAKRASQALECFETTTFVAPDGFQTLKLGDVATIADAKAGVCSQCEDC